MSNSQENLKEKFYERYYQLKASEDLLNDSINLCKSIEAEGGCTAVMEEFMSKIPEYKAYDDDVISVKRILQEISSNERELIVAIAELNHLYDMACSKSYNMLLIHEIFKCYF